MRIKKDDALWKGILEDVFDDFLVFMFEEKANIFDFSRPFEFLNKELAQIYPVDENAEHPKYVDKLVKVFTKEGKEEWILVHVEVQGYNDPDFAERMFTYFYRILDKFNKRVTCIALFTGNEKTTVTNKYHYEFLGTENHFKYNVYNIIEQDVDELNTSDNPFALVVQTALIALQKGRLGEEYVLRLYNNIARRLFQTNIAPLKTRAVMNFLKYYVSFENRENITKFEQEINALTNNTFTMGIEELLLERAERRGIEKGIEKGIERGIEKSAFIFVQKLFTDTDFDDNKIASLASVDLAFVKEVRAKMRL